MKKNYKILQAMGVYLFDIKRKKSKVSARVGKLIQLKSADKQVFESVQHINGFMSDFGYQEEQDSFI